MVKANPLFRNLMCTNYLYSLLILLFLQSPVSAQSVAKPAESAVISTIFNLTYHNQFKSADSLLTLHQKLLENNVSYQVAVVNYYWWRLISGGQTKLYSSLFDKNIKKAIALVENNKTALTREQFFGLVSMYAFSARAKLLNYAYFSAQGDLSDYYATIKKTFDFEKTYSPFYLTSGLYYFFMGYARIKQPLLTPILLLYREGDVEKGIKYLVTASQSAYPTISTEGNYFLMKIYHDLLHRQDEAAKYCHALLLRFPDNLLFNYYHFTITLQQ